MHSLKNICRFLARADLIYLDTSANQSFFHGQIGTHTNGHHDRIRLKCFTFPIRRLNHCSRIIDLQQPISSIDGNMVVLHQIFKHGLALVGDKFQAHEIGHGFHN